MSSQMNTRLGSEVQPIGRVWLAAMALLTARLPLTAAAAAAAAAAAGSGSGGGGGSGGGRDERGYLWFADGSVVIGRHDLGGGRGCHQWPVRCTRHSSPNPLGPSPPHPITPRSHSLPRLSATAHSSSEVTCDRRAVNDASSSSQRHVTTAMSLCPLPTSLPWVCLVCPSTLSFFAIHFFRSRIFISY